VAHYNASAFNPGAPTTLQLDTFLSDLNTNVTGAFLLAQAFVPVLRQHAGAALFLTGGGSALHPSAFVSSLSLGKAAMRSLAFSLAEECAPLGIHVATVTIGGMVKAGTRFDPALIAAEFWRLYQQPASEWQTEVLWD
jgi:NAD(P)-dependent dehydrogenase (short-subunit alcohol dehydrogenase family)